jgi:hypothetical protein
MKIADPVSRILVTRGRCVYLGPRAEDLRRPVPGHVDEAAALPEVAIYFDPSRGRWVLSRLGHGLVFVDGRFTARRVATRLRDRAALWLNGVALTVRLHHRFAMLVRDHSAARLSVVRTRLSALPNRRSQPPVDVAVPIRRLRTQIRLLTIGAGT